MFIALMAIFAFVIAAVALGGVSLIMSVVGKRMAGWDSRCRAMEKTIAESTPTQFKAVLDALAAAQDADRERNRKEFGKLWAKSGGKPASAQPTLGPMLQPANDMDFDAMLDLQGRTPPDIQ